MQRLVDRVLENSEIKIVGNSEGYMEGTIEHINSSQESKRNTQPMQQFIKSTRSSISLLSDQNIIIAEKDFSINKGYIYAKFPVIKAKFDPRSGYSIKYQLLSDKKLTNIILDEFHKNPNDIFGFFKLLSDDDRITELKSKSHIYLLNTTLCQQLSKEAKTLERVAPSDLTDTKEVLKVLKAIEKEKLALYNSYRLSC